jgi:hypothetical protein
MGGPPPDIDVDLLLSDLDEQSQDVDETREVSDQLLESDTSGGDEVKDGFVRLADYLKKQMSKKALQKHPFSRRAMALRAYMIQKETFSDSDNSEVDALMYKMDSKV